MLGGLVALCARAAGPCQPVSGERIEARDLARQLPEFAALEPGMLIGYAPLAGARRVLTVQQLENLARKAGVAVRELQPVCFERAVVFLNREQLERLLASQLPGVEVRVVDFPKGPVPEGELEFPLAGLRRPVKAGPETVVLWRGRVRYGEHRTYPVWVKVQLAQQVNQLVARRALAAGEVLGPADIEPRTVVAFPELHARRNIRLEQVIGRRLRKAVRAGEVIDASAVEIPPEVEAGSTVEVTVTSGLARIRFETKAETGGAAGDWIWVRNPQGGRRFQVRVCGPGKAELVLGGES